SASSVCGSYCSGADSDSSTNVGGNQPEDYIGEIGTAAFSAGGVDGPCPADLNGMCFDGSGALGAVYRYQHSTGIGVAYYYVAYGPTSSYKPSSMSAYCWGWAQGYAAVVYAVNNYSSYLAYPYLSMMVMDIEGEGIDGWSTDFLGDNRLVFNGFTDFVAGRASADSGCPGQQDTYFFQYMLYTSSNTWGYLCSSSADDSILNTPIWTTEPYNAYGHSSLPSSMNPAVTYTPLWSTYSDYLENWQFYESSSPDYDMGFNAWYMPYFGSNMS
ncbi:MAG: hypothetical protein ABSF33_19065, partial [Acidimicrobiales bacterium]